MAAVLLDMTQVRVEGCACIRNQASIVSQSSLTFLLPIYVLLKVRAGVQTNAWHRVHVCLRVDAVLIPCQQLCLALDCARTMAVVEIATPLV